MKYFIIMLLVQLCAGVAIIVAAPTNYEAWIKDLGNDKYQIRELATRDLINAGEDALPLVSKAKKNDDAEVRQRAIYVVRRIELNAEQEALKAIGSKDYLTTPGSKMGDVAHTKDDYGFVWDLQIYANPEKSIPYLKKFKRLKEITIFTPISEECAKKLGKIHSLEYLSVYQRPHKAKTKVSGDIVLKHIKYLSNLEVLDLSSCDVTDAGMKHLKGMKKLYKLNLTNNPITDKSLKIFERLPELKSLHIEDTEITGDAAVDLQDKLPNCTIHFWLYEDASIDSINP